MTRHLPDDTHAENLINMCLDLSLLKVLHTWKTCKLSQCLVRNGHYMSNFPVQYISTRHFLVSLERFEQRLYRAVRPYRTFLQEGRGLASCSVGSSANRSVLPQVGGEEIGTAG